jgi:hypothetical protein
MEKFSGTPLHCGSTASHRTDTIMDKPDFKLRYLGATEALDRIKARTLSSVALVQGLLARPRITRPPLWDISR